MRTVFVLCATCYLFVSLHSIALAWQVTLTKGALPDTSIAVDKDKKNFFFLREDCTKESLVPCTTGKVDGDKQVLHDLKTPEGIYFVQKHIPRGLDFREYGGRAFTLDYPNPVDILRGKTGSGIWIHSKGYGLVPTRGCVAIGLNDLIQAEKRIRRGMPVIIAETIECKEKDPESEIALAFKNRMLDWAKAWGARSERMFSFYDAKSYSRTTEPFDAFRKNKERIFKTHGPIQLKTHGVSVLEGPGYWVTFAKQSYASEQHKSEGLRILYWMPRGQHMRIVGMRWMTTHNEPPVQYLESRKAKP
ncbi:MAG: L,D-transpeptidase family protein [Desulfovibrionaceae bacterium]|nr:L,D-transpeptidase family protein [Desulfovibrionaceae bacterium]